MAEGERRMQREVVELLKAIAEQPDSEHLRKELFEKKLLARTFAACPDAEQAAMLAEIAFKRLADFDKQVELKRAEWDEFKSKACTDWKRVRSEIEHENLLINHRLSWLFTSQIFLFGAFAAVFQAALKEDLLGKSLPVQVVLLAIGGVGVSVCLFIMVCVDAAFKQMEFLENWWFAHYLSHTIELHEMFDVEKLRDHPPVNGIFDAWLNYALNSKWLPLPVIVGWLALVSAIWFDKVLNYQQPVIWTVSVSAIILFLGAVLWKVLKIKRRRPDREVGGWRRDRREGTAGPGIAPDRGRR